LYAKFDEFVQLVRDRADEPRVFNDQAKLWQSQSGLRMHYGGYFSPYYRDTTGKAGRDNKATIQLCEPYYRFLYEQRSQLLRNECFRRLAQSLLAAMYSTFTCFRSVLVELRESYPRLYARLAPEDAPPPIAIRLLRYEHDDRLATNPHVDKSALTVILDSDDPSSEGRLLVGDPSVSTTPQRLSAFKVCEQEPGTCPVFFGAALKEAGYGNFRPMPHAVRPFDSAVRHSAVFFWLLPEHDMSCFDTTVLIDDDIGLKRYQLPKTRPVQINTPQPVAFIERQASAYDQLVRIYEANHATCKPVRDFVLDRVVCGLPNGASALDVGCGEGSYLQLMSERGLTAQGIDVSPKMVEAAMARSKCPVTCGDFQTHHWNREFDLVFAQALVHLFPKSSIMGIVEKLKSLATHRVYFSTSLADVPCEGWEHKDGALRFRSRYTADEFARIVSLATADGEWESNTFELTDPQGKRWVQVVLDRIASRSVGRGAKALSRELEK
jgi:SAM-dependent methyltransferase